MRGELFPEFSEELTEYIETHVAKENPHLTEDYELLKQHYSIVLEYLNDIESKLRKEKEQTRKLKSQISCLKEQSKDNVVFDKSIDSTIKTLKCSVAAAKSNYTKEKKKREEVEKLLAECMSELNELRGFKNRMISILNNKEN